MNPIESSSTTVLVEEAFHEYLEILKDGSRPKAEEFLGTQDPDIREELARVLDDYQALSTAFGATTSGFRPGGVVGDFRLVQEIGRGGMGTVWEAEQISIGRSVALKILHPHYCLTSAGLLRFQREAAAAGRIDHSGVVTVYAIGESEGVHYIAQQLVGDGQSLADWIGELRESGETLPEDYRKAARIIAEVAGAVEAAHREGVIHRDLKPGNILLGPDGKPRVGDFGLASVAGNPALSRTGDFQGTLAYMSPEQAASRRMGIDERTDIFSLGATLYEALAGVRPFEGDSPQQIVRKILQEEPADPRRYRSRIPRDLAVICLRAMEKRPENRFACMDELAADLLRFLNGESIRSVPPGWPVRAARWCRRHPWPTAAAVLTLTGLSAVSALWIQNRAAWQESERSLAITSRVLDLTSELLEGLDPDSSSRPLRADAELAARIREAERVARVDLADRPLMAADLREALARVYIGHTQFTEGARLLRLTHATRSAELGASHRKTLLAALLLGEALAGAGQGFEGFRVLERSAELACEARGPEDPLVIDLVTRAYSIIYTYSLNSHLVGFWERWGDGSVILTERLGELTQERGPGDAQTLKVQRALAYILSRQGQADEAVKLLEAGLAAGRLELGGAHLVTLTLEESLNVSRALVDGDWMAHREEFERIWKLRCDLQGREHPMTLGARLCMGWMSLEGGELDVAEEIYREILEPVAENWGKYSRKSLLLRMHLAVMVRRAGRLAEAEEMFLPLIEDFVAAPNVGRRAGLACNTVRALAEIYEEQGRYGETRELLEENLAILFEEDPRLGSIELASNCIVLARVLVKSGQVDESLVLLRRLAQEIELRYGADTKQAVIHRAPLVRGLLEAGRWEEALEEALAYQRGTEALGEEGEEAARDARGMVERARVGANVGRDAGGHAGEGAVGGR